MLYKFLLWPAAVVLIVAFGVAEGLWSGRWDWFEGPEQASAKLAAVPRTVGDWQSKEMHLDERAIAAAEISGYLWRVYTNQVTGATVQVLMVCGRPGPTSVHTPEVCYGGAGYKIADAAAARPVEAPGLRWPAVFWTCRFQKAGPSPEALQIYWAWNATGEWLAANNPRWSLGHHRYLYKLYVVRSLSNTEGTADDTVTDFMRQFLPALENSLYGETSAQSAVPQRGEGRWSC
jgi:Protein of unknown function (DUF3485)